ncbi:MAG: universal stress protein [Bacteroidetes bacterium]|nr:universal stress protein [Bacteroidota bacterium]
MESENNNVILVASDFTPIGEYAVDNAIAMAKLINYKICVLHVINQATKAALKKENKSLEFIYDKLKEISNDIKQKHGIDCDYVAKEGSIFSAIAEVADTIGAAYLFIGTHGKKGIQMLLGSFALKVVKSSPVPIFVLQKMAEGIKYKDVVFPLDIAMGSKQKVKWAITLHKQFQSTFHIFCLNPGDAYMRNRLRADLNQVKRIMEKHNIPHTETFHNHKGPAFSKQVVNFAKEKNADFIMISTDPDKISWSLWGSDDERIIYNQEKIPVMCINAQDLKVIIGGL